MVPRDLIAHSMDIQIDADHRPVGRHRMSGVSFLPCVRQRAEDCSVRELTAHHLIQRRAGPSGTQPRHTRIVLSPSPGGPRQVRAVLLMDDWTGMDWLLLPINTDNE